MRSIEGAWHFPGARAWLLDWSIMVRLDALT